MAAPAMAASASPFQLDAAATYQAYVNRMLFHQAEAKEGNLFPNVALTELNPENKPVEFNVYGRFSELRAKRIVVVVPVKAWTPVCTAHHLPAYAAKEQELRKAHVDAVAVLSRDDFDSQNAWIKSKYPLGNFIVGLPDVFGTILQKLGLLLDRTKPRGIGLAAQRAVLIIDKAVEGREIVWRIKHIQVEKDPRDEKCPTTGVDSVLKVLSRMPAPE